ncbi:hypothetical protein ACET3Z_025344 [Daucus carota]
MEDGEIGAYLLVTGLLIFVYTVLKWNDLRYGGKSLPPGTMGLPFFGQTVEFLKQGPDFMKAQRARYGSMFKTHILGSPTIVCMDAEVNKYILMNESKGFVPGYPKAMHNILGQNNIGAVHGSPHKILRGSLLSLISPIMIKESLLPRIDNVIRYLVDGLNGKTIDIQEKTEEMAYLVSFSQIFCNIEPGTSLYNVLKSEFDKLTLGTLSLPINLPGTNYYKGLMSSKNIMKYVSKIIEGRRVASVPPHKDQLNELLGIIDSKYQLSDEDVINQIFTLLYSGYETVSTTTMMVLKYLHDHPKALQELRDEHFRIREGKKPNEGIDWSEYKSMTFTRAVIFEATRLKTVVNGVLRRTIEDVELNGMCFMRNQG